MKFTIAIGLILFGLAQNSYAGELAVIDVRRNITLSEEDTVYKDFYLGGAGASGLKKNMVVTAVRKLNIRDASGANAFGEIQVPVGQLKIIAVYDNIAVAREFTLLSRDELPMLEQIGIMTGDRIETKGSFIDTSKPKKRKVSEVTETTATGVVVTTTGTAGPAPASEKATAPVSPTLVAKAPEAKAQEALAAAPSQGEKLEKVGDSGNTSTHE
ncbi:hypothetical protein [Bdellovibrio sp. HCB2-146]|uniref:hypothetical protein n=1 Tax=Bdellovibrio sp. HCB2-146 TaxID=3394362 RepID=UPI0039BD8DCB